MTTFEALGDPTRRRIVELVAERERSAGEIAAAFSISRPGVSKHLRVLREEGAPGMEHPTDEGLKVCQPQGPGLTDLTWALPLRLMHGGPAATGSPMPGAPLPALPPQGGRGIARRLCVSPLALRGGGGARPVSAAYGARNRAFA